jgi:hypothetical protein
MNEGSALKEIKNNKHNLGIRTRLVVEKVVLEQKFHPTISEVLFQSLTVLCQFLIAFIFKSSITSSVHLFSGHLVFIVSFILAVAICLGTDSFLSFKYAHTMFILAIFINAMSAPVLTICSYSAAFFFLYGPLLFLTFFLSNNLRDLISADVIFQPSARGMELVLLQTCSCLA